MEKEVRTMATSMNPSSSSSSSEGSTIKIVYRPPPSNRKKGADKQRVKQVIDHLNIALMKSIPNIDNHNKNKSCISKNPKYLLTINILQCTTKGSRRWGGRRICFCFCGDGSMGCVVALKISWKLTTKTVLTANEEIVLAEGTTKKLSDSNSMIGSCGGGGESGESEIIELLNEMTTQISKEISLNVIEGIVLYIRNIKATAPAAAA